MPGWSLFLPTTKTFGKPLTGKEEEAEITIQYISFSSN